MFENLLFQQHFTSTIIREIEDGSLPQSILFYGEAYSGKLTAALELARVLNCELDGAWGCRCRSCLQNLTLDNPYTLLTGSRYCIQEIRQSSEVLKSQRSVPSQYIFIRNVRKLIKRFNEDLWDRDDNKYKKAVTSLNKIDDVLHLVEPGHELPAEKKLQSTVKKILTECEKLSNELPKGNIPINQIRKISSWVRRSTSGAKKVVILERAELMQDSSRNALLKILEEPPADTYFILISQKKSTVLPTILSRVRAYPFKMRDEKEQQLILEKLFKTENGESSLKNYFFKYANIDEENVIRVTEAFMEVALQRESTFSDAVDIKIDGDYFIRFLELLTEKVKSYYLERDMLNLNQVEVIMERIRDIIIKQAHYNQNPMLLLETLFYEIKRIIK